VSAIVSVGHSERAPTLTELYAAGPFIGVLQQGTSRLIGDPNLKSEKNTQFDLGLQAEYDWVQFGGGLFYSWINNYITYDQNRGGPGLTQVVYTNTDLATLAGAELFGQMDVTTWMSVFGTMTYVQGVDQTHNQNNRSADLSSSRATNPANGQYATDTEPLPQIPPLESRVGFRIHDPNPARKWQVEFGARMVASQNNIAKSLGELGTPGFTTFNIRTYWQATNRLLLTAGVENLGNLYYREHLDPVSGTILGVNPLYRPGTNFYFGSQLSY
jgi:outer membrane receptor protein involved in Fe transport